MHQRGYGTSGVFRQARYPSNRILAYWAHHWAPQRDCHRPNEGLVRLGISLDRGSAVYVIKHAVGSDVERESELPTVPIL